jgi:hypothetical protein
MIPYDELVAALASWRQRQGLPAGPADYLGEPAQANYDDGSSPSSGGGYGGHGHGGGGGYGGGGGGYGGGGYGGGGYGGEDVVELSDEMMDSVVEEQSNPYAVEAEEMVDPGESQLGSDTQDDNIDAYLDSALPAEPAAPEPEPQKSGGRRKRKR